MAPIRVAIIGLSASAKTSWAAEGHLPYLLSSEGRAKYQIVALVNSSVEAAKQARSTYELPDSVKTYGSPKEVANDPNVDLVVNNTRVDVHYDTIKPSIEAGKNIYVEWPLAENVDRARELASLAKAKNVRTVIGLQGRLSPVVLKVTDLLENNAIGKVLSADVQAYGNLFPRSAFPDGVGYFTERKVGGHPISIAFAHMIDYIHSVLGEFETSHSESTLQRPDIDILEAKLGSYSSSIKVLKTVKSDVPDLVSIHGQLRQSDTIAKDAVLTVTYRNGPPFKNQPAMVWSINGERGEIRIESVGGPFLQSDSYHAPIKISVHDHGSDEVREVPWHWNELQSSLPERARKVSQVYERFYAEGKNGKYPTFEDAVIRHAEIDGVLMDYDTRLEKN